MSKTSKESIDISNNFDTNGYLIERDFFDPELVNNAFDELVKNHDVVLEKLLLMVDNGLMDKSDLAIESGKLKYLKNANLYFNSLKLLVDSNLNKVVTSLMGENVFIETIELHQKYGGVSETPPHQDNFYFCLENAKSFTAYIPLNRQ
ncbi:hypothetical protein N9T26_02240, partial [Alphaproteobacteria bacterium]|nr:hypothetical protein [Alphaproteobacteria bacterium]